MACPQGQMWLPHPVSGELASRIAGVETARRASQSPQGVSQPGTCILPFLPRHCAHLCPATPERLCGPGSLLSPGKPGLAERTPAPPCPLRAPALTAPSACRDSRPSGRCWAHRRSASSCGAGSASWWPRGRQTQVRASPAPLAPSRPSWPPPASCGLLSSHVRAPPPCGVRASPGEQCWPVGVALPGLGLPCREWGFMRAPQAMPIKRRPSPQGWGRGPAPRAALQTGQGTLISRVSDGLAPSPLHGTVFFGPKCVLSPLGQESL